MVALNENFAFKNPALGSKNRVGNFFGGVAVRAGENRPATRNRIGEKRPTLTIIASGRPVWPSRDPIEEWGGLNLYGMIGNNSVNSWDYLGMTVITYEPKLVSGRNQEFIDSGTVGAEVITPAYASVGIDASDSGVVGMASTSIGGRVAFSVATYSVKCDREGNISYQEDPNSSGSSDDMLTMVLARVPDFGVPVPKDILAFEVIAIAAVYPDNSVPFIPTPGSPLLLDFLLQIFGAAASDPPPIRAERRELYEYKCVCVEGP